MLSVIVTVIIAIVLVTVRIELCYQESPEPYNFFGHVVESQRIGQYYVCMYVCM